MKKLFNNKLFRLVLSFALAITSTILGFKILSFIFWSYPVIYFLYAFYYGIKNTINDIKENNQLKSFKGEVTGIVRCKGEVVPTVSVRVRNPDDIFDKTMSTYGCYTDNSGKFKITNIKNGKFILVCDKLYYKEKIQNITILDSNNKLYFEIEIEEDPDELKSL